MKSKAVAGIMLTLLLIGLLTLASNVQTAKVEPRTWTVDDDGPADFSSVQEAINMANPGDTIYVYNGIYYENVVVNKTVSLLGEDRDTTIIDGKSPETGIAVHITANDVDIFGFTIQNGYHGILLNASSRIRIKTNTITNNFFGIYMRYSSNNSLSVNTIIANYYSIYVWHSETSNIGSNTLTNNTHGIELWFSNTIVSDENFIIDNEHYGIYLYRSDINIISGNTFKNNHEDPFGFDGYAVWLDRSNGNEVISNIVVNNTDGIFLYYSSNVTVLDNIVFNNNRGLNIVVSNDNYIEGNSFFNNEEGVVIGSDANSNVIRDNEISNNDFGIHVGWSMGNNIVGNTISLNAYAGIRFDSSNSNSIIGNTITSSNRDGIVLFGSNGNAIINNDLIQNKWDGIAVWYSNSNVVYHNNFQNNTKQAGSYSGSTNVWDDGYPSGGNYWSDYEVRYLEAEELDDSGIWDTPYVMDGDNQDNYPLMEPWSPLPRTLEELKTEIEELGSEGEIDNQGIAKSLIAKLNVAQRMVDKGKVNEAKTILEDDFILQVQNLSGTHITIEAADILIQSAEYILSHL